MKDKNNTITVYSMLFSFCLEVFSKTLYLLLGKGGYTNLVPSFILSSYLSTLLNANRKTYLITI